MAGEIEPQTNTEGSVSESAPEIGRPVEAQSDKGPAPIYEDTEKEPDGEVDKENEPAPEADKESEKKAEKPEGEEIVISKPDESLLSDADMESIAAYSKAQGLSKEAEQKLVEYQSGVLGKHADEQMTAHERQVSGWSEECKVDKEIGGENYEKSVELAKRVVHKFGSDKFLESLNETGFGNNPEVVRCFARIGQAMASDTLVKGGAQVAGERSMADIFYGNHKEN